MPDQPRLAHVGGGLSQSPLRAFTSPGSHRSSIRRHRRLPRRARSIIGVWRWNPFDFLGSYILPLTAHSNVLQEFGGGDGRVGIHGRGGASLLDRLGTARSHGCVRLANEAIE